MHITNINNMEVIHAFLHLNISKKSHQSTIQTLRFSQKLQHQNFAEDKMGVYIILLEGGNINEWSLG